MELLKEYWWLLALGMAVGAVITQASIVIYDKYLYDGYDL